MFFPHLENNSPQAPNPRVDAETLKAEAETLQRVAENCANSDDPTACSYGEYLANKAANLLSDAAARLRNGG
jgi:hypothetical protein